MEPDGLVNFIHYHPEEKDELVTLKKALVGTMSAKFTVHHIYYHIWTFCLQTTEFVPTFNITLFRLVEAKNIRGPRSYFIE